MIPYRPSQLTAHSSAPTSALPLPFPDRHFTLVHCRKLLSSLEGKNVYMHLVHECIRVLAPGGMLVLVEGRNATSELKRKGLGGVLVSTLCWGEDGSNERAKRE